MRAALCATACLVALLDVGPIGQEGATISGHVTNAASAPIANYSVVVFSTDRSKWSTTSRVLRVAQPAQDGSFEVANLPPGEYWLAAIEPVEGNTVRATGSRPSRSRSSRSARGA